MKTAEQIAREAAARLVRAKFNNDYALNWQVWVGEMIVDHSTSQERAEGLASNLIDSVRPAILAAIEEDRQQPPPVESPVSVERLAEAKAYSQLAKSENRGWIFVPHMEAQQQLEAQQQHIAHLERLVRWLMHEHSREDAEALLTQARQAGYEEGKRNGRSSDSWGALDL